MYIHATLVLYIYERIRKTGSGPLHYVNIYGDMPVMHSVHKASAFYVQKWLCFIWNGLDCRACSLIHIKVCPSWEVHQWSFSMYMYSLATNILLSSYKNILSWFVNTLKLTTIKGYVCKWPVTTVSLYLLRTKGCFVEKSYKHRNIVWYCSNFLWKGA
jgi:hypothetical protein